LLLFSYLLISGVTTGALYALVALGIVVVNKATGVINFAQGEFFMFSGFVGWMLHVQYGMNYPLSFLLAVTVGFVLGMLTDRIAFRPIAKDDIVSLVLATVGIGFILKGLARVIWGGKADYLSFPPITSPDPIMVGPVMVIPQQLAVLAGTVIIMLIFAAFFRLTRAGKMMQATADNSRAALLVGIRAAIAAAAAVLTAPLTLLYPDIGFAFFLKGFAAAVLGGLTSLPGAVLGGLMVGVAESLAGGYIHSSVMELSPFLVIMIVLVLRPTGLLSFRKVRRV
jgi:branched-chain amino acid transport system permease protein